MNLREIIRSGYKVFNRMSEDKRKAHILAVQYIETLANSTNTKMEPWDLSVIFGTGKGNELVTDKIEINKRFFSKVEELKTNTPAHVFSLETRIQGQIDNLTRAHNERATNEIKRSRDQQIRSASDFGVRMNAAMEEARRLELNLMAIEGRQSTISGQISRLIQEPYWEFHELNGALLYLVTKNDLILTQKNTAANLDLRVNVGKFKLEINLNALQLRVLAHSDNLNVNNYYHPHVTPQGSICWGTAAGVITQKLPKGELYDSVKLLEGVLSNYNDGNPYVHLADFQKVCKNSAPPKDNRKEDYRDERPNPPADDSGVEIRVGGIAIGRTAGGRVYPPMFEIDDSVTSRHERLAAESVPNYRLDLPEVRIPDPIQGMDPIVMDMGALHEALNRLRGVYDSAAPSPLAPRLDDERTE